MWSPLCEVIHRLWPLRQAVIILTQLIGDLIDCSVTSCRHAHSQLVSPRTGSLRIEYLRNHVSPIERHLSIMIILIYRIAIGNHNLQYPVNVNHHEQTCHNGITIVAFDKDRLIVFFDMKNFNVEM